MPVLAQQDVVRKAPPSFDSARRTAQLDELRLDGDQDADRADLGVLRLRVGLGRGAIRAPGPSALVTSNPFGTGNRHATPTPLKATVN
jgi:hypothetical protein